MDDNLAVMSIGFLLSSPDDAVIWRGPKKNGVFMCHFYLIVSECYETATCVNLSWNRDDQAVFKGC